MTSERFKFSIFEKRFGYWTSRALILCLAGWSIVILTRMGRLFHEMFCAQHGAWPVL